MTDEPNANDDPEPAPGAESPSRLVVATYNVHRCIGADGRHDPLRIARVLEQMSADIVGLQEVSTRTGALGDVDQLEVLAAESGMHAVAGPTQPADRGHCGNALLSRWPIRALRQVDLSVAGREQRGAIDAEIDFAGRWVRIVVTHLGLRRRERFDQTRRLFEALAESTDRDEERAATIILADGNEWLPLGRARRRLRSGYGFRPVPTFPARLPVLPLDVVLVSPAAALGSVQAHRTGLSRVASDHLPAKAIVHLARETPDAGTRVA
jgi:endonuclease/exonuclease/phosphatase family metal-dependent hydrolase